jgi:hypothetical protein
MGVPPPLRLRGRKIDHPRECIATGWATRACTTAFRVRLGCGVRRGNSLAVLSGMSDAGWKRAERPSRSPHSAENCGLRIMVFERDFEAEPV